MSTDTNNTLVLFSGGQDSTTCLAWALERYAHIETVGFDYGQRHSIEMDCRPRVLDAMRESNPDWANRLGEDHVIDLGVLGEISDTSLTSDAEIRMNENGLPNTFVPGRNLIFLTFAAAVAYRRGIKIIVAGVCETDYSGYPDCRNDTMQAMQNALTLGMDEPFVIETPLMWIDKAETWAMTEDLGGKALVDIIVEETHTCYLGERGKRHDWGYGCGTCPSCELRRNGWNAYTG
ncbi:MAG: 7-cyano-7-deazaguanine synthase QueC [Rhodospirillales bacterium]|jgi:7-cyano-7-deazaguanine synthase|nr:7-cyano-7-deazaguanine synthase QueC [Rhodospirillales bacterium]